MAIGVIFLVYMALNALSNILFQLSAGSQGVSRFVFWQILGNLVGFLGVLTFTGLLHYLPISVAFPVAQGLAVLGVQLVGARLFFKETIHPAQWIGSGLIVAGIVLIAQK